MEGVIWLFLALILALICLGVVVAGFRPACVVEGHVACLKARSTLCVRAANPTVGAGVAVGGLDSNSN
jgi:hypothetical protein